MALPKAELQARISVKVPSSERIVGDLFKPLVEEFGK